MRTSFETLLNDSESEELLTTGEAALLLGVSRQHVVDLCDRGDIPFVTMGTHRRLRRVDVERYRAQGQRMTRDQRRSLWISYAVAAELVAEPHRVLESAKQSLRQHSDSRRADKWTREWSKLLNGPLEQCLEALTSPSVRSRELRQNSPFVEVLTPEKREHVLRSFREWTTGHEAK